MHCVLHQRADVIVARGMGRRAGYCEVLASFYIIAPDRQRRLQCTTQQQRPNGDDNGITLPDMCLCERAHIWMLLAVPSLVVRHRRGEV